MSSLVWAMSMLRYASVFALLWLLVACASDSSGDVADNSLFSHDLAGEVRHTPLTMGALLVLFDVKVEERGMRKEETGKRTSAPAYAMFSKTACRQIASLHHRACRAAIAAKALATV